MALLNPNLSDFWFAGEPSEATFRKARNRVLYGGRASSKSWEFAGMAVHLAANYQTRFLCVRRYQNKIKESVYTLIKKQIERSESKSFSVLATEIRNANGSDFSFYGIEKNVEEIRSFEGADILWIEEAHSLTKEQWVNLEPTIRAENSEVWISFNPKLVSDYVYERFINNPPPDTIIRLINYPDNPYLSQTALKTIQALKDEDQELYEHVYLGVPLSDDDQAVIKRSWVEAAINAHEKLGLDLSGGKTVGYDVADGGEDKNATATFDGSICVDIEEWKAPEDELVQSALRAWQKVGNGRLVYDSIGVGAHVGSSLKNKGVKYGYFKFNAGGEVQKPDVEYAPNITNKQKFENLKAQAWQDVADRFRNTYNAVNKGMVYAPSDLISISGDIDQVEQLKKELCLPHKAYSKRGLDMVEKKEDIKKRGFNSPNLADAFIMGACPHLVEQPKAARAPRFY